VETRVIERPVASEMQAAQVAPARPMMRGWSHALAAGATVILTILLCWQSQADLPRLISLLVYGLSMIELYTVSALYHIGTWSTRTRQRLRALDHANIFVLIAGTYTPLCFNVLSGWVRVALLVTIWTLAAAGIGRSFLNLWLPRWVSTSLYIGMGWVALFALPAFLSQLSWLFVATLVLGGILYTIGAVIYACRLPNPWPRIFGYHEVFHLFVIAGSIALAVAIWVWALPFARI